MTHPLTDKIIDQIQMRHGGPRYGCYPDFRAVADWQLERVIEWVKTQTDYSGTFYYEALGDIETIEDALMRAMRPQEDNQ